MTYFPGKPGKLTIWLQSIWLNSRFFRSQINILVPYINAALENKNCIILFNGHQKNALLMCWKGFAECPRNKTVKAHSGYSRQQQEVFLQNSTTFRCIDRMGDGTLKLVNRKSKPNKISLSKRVITVIVGNNFHVLFKLPQGGTKIRTSLLSQSQLCTLEFNRDISYLDREKFGLTEQLLQNYKTKQSLL